LTPWLGPTPPLWQTKTPGRKPRSASQRPDWGFLFWNNHDQLGLAKVSDSCVCEQTRVGAEASVSAATSSRGFLLMRLIPIRPIPLKTPPGRSRRTDLRLGASCARAEALTSPRDGTRKAIRHRESRSALGRPELLLLA